MNIIIEISKIILPAITTGLFTFYITKYNYNNNIPLDKLEITYNRIYYPLHKIISDKNNDIDNVVAKSKSYFDKYNKYIDKSTIRAYNLLCTCDNDAKKKNIYQKFKNNIYNKSSYLRRKLGYLEPNVFEMYKYSDVSTKSSLRISLEILFIYLSFVLSIITINITDNIYVFFILATIFVIIILFVEILIVIGRYIYYKIKK